MLRRAKKEDSRNTQIGMEVQPEGLAVAISEHANGLNRLQCHFLPFLDDSGLLEALQKFVSKHDLADKTAVFVLPEKEYSLLPSSIPAMSHEDMRVAARWKIKDMIDFSAEEAVLDIYEEPESGQRGSERSVYVVAAKRDHILKHIEQMRESELEPKAIDIGEMALRNVVAKLKENQQGVIVLHLAERSGLLVVIKEGEVYLSRRLNVGFDDLLLGDENIFEDIVLELQRSLDYFESHFSLALPGKLLVFPPDKLSGELITHINSQLRLEVEPLILEELPGYTIDTDEASQAHCLLAVGAALREEARA